MNKKMLTIVVVVLLLFVALFFVVDYKNKQAIEDNEYGKASLKQETIDQMDDPLYDNQITPEDLNATIDSGKAVTVYFYSPTCVYCQRTTPVLVPLTERLEIDMKKLNLLEFEDEWGIESTPTLVHYEDGEEVARIVGEQEEEEFEQFLSENVLD
ncbi:MAG TPA: thioredoxin family protein [Bacillota bacterium]